LKLFNNIFDNISIHLTSIMHSNGHLLTTVVTTSSYVVRKYFIITM